MTTTRFLSLAATGLLTILSMGCADQDKVASNRPARKVYRDRDTLTGSHLQRGYSDPADSTASNYSGGPGPGQQPFSRPSAAGSYNGQR